MFGLTIAILIACNAEESDSQVLLTELQPTLSRVATASDRNEYISINNLRVLGQLADAEVPAETDPPQAGMEYAESLYSRAGLTDLPAISGRVPYLASLSMRESTKAQLGVDHRNFGYVIVQEYDTSVVEYTFGEFTAAQVTQAITNCNNCIVPSTEEHDGSTYYQWNPDLSKQEFPPFYNKLAASAIFLLPLDGLIILTHDESAIREYINSFVGQDTSTSGISSHAMLLSELAQRGVASMVVSFEDYSLDNVLSAPLSKADEWKNNLESTPFLREFVAAAAGSRVEENTYYEEYVIEHIDIESAEINRQRLQDRVMKGLTANGEPWSSRISSIELEVEDSLLFATVIPAPVTTASLDLRPHSFPNLLVHE